MIYEYGDESVDGERRQVKRRERLTALRALGRREGERERGREGGDVPSFTFIILPLFLSLAHNINIQTFSLSLVQSCYFPTLSISLSLCLSPLIPLSSHSPLSSHPPLYKEQPFPSLLSSLSPLPLFPLIPLSSSPLSHPSLLSSPSLISCPSLHQEQHTGAHPTESRHTLLSMLLTFLSSFLSLPLSLSFSLSSLHPILMEMC